MGDLRTPTPPPLPLPPTPREPELAEVQAERDQLISILNGIAEAIMVRTARGRLIYVNDPAARNCGYPDARTMLAAAPINLAERVELYDPDGRPLRPGELSACRVATGELPWSEALLRYRPAGGGLERWSLMRV